MSVLEFRLPDLGEGLAEAEVIRWLVEVGDAVEVDQPVVEVETAKASVEIPCPFAGIVTARNGEVGDVLPVGALLVSVGETDDASADGSAEASGNVLIGYGTGATEQGPRRRRVLRAAVGPPDGREANDGGGTGHVAQAPAAATPLVRKHARDLGIDLATVVGSGPGGAVLRSDIARDQPRADSEQRPDATSVRIPLTGSRRLAAERFTRSRREIPEATVWLDADATALVQTRAAIEALQPGRPVTLLSLLTRFAVLGLIRFPELNSRVDIERGEIELLTELNIGFAAQTARGLVVPVIHEARNMSVHDLALEIGRLTDLARGGHLSTRDLTGGTFTVNNYGMFGVDGSAAIINYPEAAILGLGRIHERPWVVGGAIAVRQVAQLTLAFDHRVCDGAAAGGFLRFVGDCVENPGGLIGDL